VEKFPVAFLNLLIFQNTLKTGFLRISQSWLLRQNQRENYKFLWSDFLFIRLTNLLYGVKIFSIKRIEVEEYAIILPLRELSVGARHRQSC
jgi:hypothetical protein